MPSDPETTIVVVFARPAVPGATKTRLAATEGAAAAARLAAAFVADTWATVTSLPWAGPVLCCPGAPIGLPEASELWDQPGADLGERLASVIGRGLERAPRVIVVGSDAPTLPRARLEAIRDALDDADAAFVPARDGGFVALGMRRASPAAFSAVRWGTSHAHEDLSGGLRAAGLRVVDVAPWFDVDDAADLDLLSADPALPGSAPATASVLREFRGGTGRRCVRFHLQT